jgi:xanthine/uracil permease
MEQNTVQRIMELPGILGFLARVAFLLILPLTPIYLFYGEDFSETSSAIIIGGVLILAWNLFVKYKYDYFYLAGLIVGGVFLVIGVFGLPESF